MVNIQSKERDSNMYQTLTRYSNNVNSYNVQQGSYPPPPPPPYVAPTVPAYPAVYPGMPGVPMQQPAQSNGSAVAALVLGIISMIAWLIPILGVILSCIGLALVKRARRVPFQPGMIKAAHVLCTIALVLSLLNWFAGFPLAMH